MSTVASLGRLPSQSLFGRFVSLIGTALDSVALIASHNGDLPYTGL